MPKVSVIIPVYNVEKYLERCLDSVINQTLKDIEIICINDCSPDNSLEILKKYAKKDSRIQIVDLKENKGAAIARNEGLKIAQGEYIGFVDPDDYVELDFYEKLYNRAVETSADIVKGDVKTHFLDGNVLKSDELNSLINKNKFYFLYNWWSAIYKASLVFNNKITFPDECPKAQDVVFLNRCLIKSKKVVTLEDAYYCHIKREGSLDSSGLPSKHAYSAIRAGEIILQELNEAYSTNSIDNNTYAIFYGKRIINVLVRTYYLTSDVSVKNDCVFQIVDQYNQCLEKEKFDDFFECKLMLKTIRGNDCEKLFELLNKYSAFEQYWRDEFLFNLRQNARKDMQNA